MDFSKATDRIFTGAAINSKQDIDELVSEGVTHIIDARAEFDDAALLMADYPQVLYLWNPTADDGMHPKPVEWFKRALDFGMPALSRPGKIVFAHCAAGVNRGPSMAYTLLRAQGLSSESAKRVLKFHRPQVGIAYADDADLALKELGWVK